MLGMMVGTQITVFMVLFVIPFGAKVHMISVG